MNPRVIACSLALPLAAGCAGTPPAGAVVPGLLLATAQLSGPDTVVYRRSISHGGRDSTAGTRTVVRRIVHGAGGATLLEVEQRFPGGGGEIVDTAVAELTTLRAVAHRSHQPRRTMRFEFVRDSALGTVDTASVHQALGGPIFDSNVLDVVVAALPLTPQFSVELPFFIYERGGRVPMAVRVTERTRATFPDLGERDVWVVSVGVPGAPATVWVDTATRAVVRVRYNLTAATTSFTDDRSTPLQRQAESRL